MRPFSLMTFLAVIAVASTAAVAQPAPPITKEQAHFVVTEVERLIAEHYVFPEKRQQIVDAIKSADTAGRYNTTDPRELSDHLTDDLRATANDRHLAVRFDPERYAELMKPGQQHDGGLQRRAELRHNHGYEEQRVLPGNIRYVRISGFIWSKERTPRVIDDAARFLSDGDAIIIDLRGNGGGDADAVERMISYFFPASSKQELMTFYDGLEGSTTVNRVVPSLPSPRLTGKPFYLLIDGRTGSAAEEFTYHTQQFKLGTLIGAKTGGAGNNNTFYPIAPSFTFSISVGRPIHPVSHTNWEAVGISPDVAVPPQLALEQAQILALRALLAKASASDRMAYEWAIAGLEAQVKPVQLTPAEMQAYVGTYGIRKVWLEGGVLRYQREELPPATLTPMGDDVFALSNTDQVRIKFRRKDGRVVGFDQVFDDGSPNVPSERTA